MTPPPRPGSHASRRPFDWSEWYVEDLWVGESCEQGAIIDELRSSLRELARRRHWTRYFVGGDNYFAWMRSEPLVRVSPDVYLMDVTPPDPLPTIWETWRKGHKAPRWAMEIVSTNWRKDYRTNPQKYAQLGCAELVLFDPEIVLRGQGEGGERAALTVFRRGTGHGMERVYSGSGPAFSRELRAWLVAAQVGYSARVRIALDKGGERIVPTEQEAARKRTEAARKRADAETKRADAEKKRADAEKRRADRAQARARALADRLRRAGLDPGPEQE